MFDQKDFSLVSNRFYAVTGTGLDPEKITTCEDEFLGKVELRSLCRYPRKIRAGG